MRRAGSPGMTFRSRGAVVALSFVLLGGPAVVGLNGANLGSFSMMLFASTHFTNVAGPGNTPPIVSAAPLPVSGGSDQQRIVDAVKRVEPSVVSLLVTVNGTRVVPNDPFQQFF